MSPLLAHKADITRLSSKRPKISKIFCEASPHSARATVFGGVGYANSAARNPLALRADACRSLRATRQSLGVHAQIRLHLDEK